MQVWHRKLLTSSVRNLVNRLRTLSDFNYVFLVHLPLFPLLQAPCWGLSQKLARIVGSQRASVASFSSKWITAEEALAWGLLVDVVEPDALMDAARGLADVSRTFFLRLFFIHSTLCWSRIWNAHERV